MGFIQEVYSNLPRTKDGAYDINVHEKESKEHIAFHYLLTEIRLKYDFYSYGIEFVSQDVLNNIQDKSITHNIFSTTIP